MEGEPDEADEDVKDRPTVLWEKCIQQSIFVDLSEDESLHLSDLENSFAIHLSQAESAASEASIHLSGSAELSALDVTSSESSTVSSQSERLVKNKIKSSKLHVSAQRPNTMQGEPPLNQGYEDAGQDTSDEDQDDLPYDPFDGDLGSTYFNKTSISEVERSSEGRATVHASPDALDWLECNQIERDDLVKHLFSVEHNAEKPAALLQEDANTKQDHVFNALKPKEFAPSCPADINQVLLRHFSQEELLRPGRLIDAETLPEVSLLESMDGTVMSWAPAHNSTTNNSNNSESFACNSEMIQSSCAERSNEKSHDVKSSLVEEPEERPEKVNASASNCIASSSQSPDSKQDTSAVDLAKQEKSQENDQVRQVPLVRTRSFTEMKYGQGQVHYPLPDFSKVAPKVKIPKAPSGPAQLQPLPQSPSTMHRAQSSPGMLEVISRVLEDSVQLSEKPYVFKDEDKQTPALVHHLQAEYDKLLTKYAEAENLIDQMRVGTNAQSSSELMLHFECEDNHLENIPLVKGIHIGSLAPVLPTSGEKIETNSQNKIKEMNTDSSNQPEEGPSYGEIMTTELKDIISQFMQRVEELKMSVSNMSVSTAEQHMMLRGLMEAQDQLERKYISKKEEHRALEMQNYMGLCRNTGTFDPNRLVEGDIFRIGMHLEDIKELIDKNVYEQISPPHSSSTPTPMRQTQHVMLNPLCILTPSPPPYLHEGPCSGFSTAGFHMEKEEENMEKVKKDSKVYGDVQLQESHEVLTTNSLMRNSGHSSCHSRSSQGSVEGLEIHTAETEEEERTSVFSDEIDHSNILAYLDGSSSSFSGQIQRTADSHSTLVSVLHAVGECDQGDCVSLAVELSCLSDAPRDSDIHNLSEPPLQTSSSAQRIVSPETDSGFGSSYLNNSASGSFESNRLTERVPSQNDGLSSTDSEDSCSNLQTAIHSASLPSQLWVSPSQSVETQSCGGTAAVERWVQSTTKEPLVRLQGSEGSPPAQLHYHIPEPKLSATMDTDDTGSPLNSCSCNSEAIVALQSEVSRLKKDLEEGLDQLPHLAQKMDYLTSRYREDRQERRSKTRLRNQHRLPCNSVWKPSSSRQPLSDVSSSQVKMEDWISSDMDPSRSKGTDSGDTAGSDNMLQFQSTPIGSRRGTGSVSCSPEFTNKLQSNQGLSCCFLVLTLFSCLINMGYVVLKDVSHVSYGPRSERNSSVKNSVPTSSILKGGKEETTDSQAMKRTQTVIDGFFVKERRPLFSSPSLQKPLLQVSYGSSSSLPASYKVREPLMQSTSRHRKRSTQSDTALLPSNVYFQRTQTPASTPSKAGSRKSRCGGSKEEEMSRTLDQAIEVARSMKRTTDRMAKRLSADLAEAKLHRKLHNIQPLGGRKHHAL
ncbi:uncharacterized protein LOC132979058 isoform X2 [Labrus mixtus]|uniref:uncharacterized protein LOC132979058 isoform X2 n=1 Tax=Labrus mixtus TaxID=508554 RepID=UPI0029C02DC7|nr:uncharacterized protein LOC132979058 isoform X2 [Labrus mixtus]